MIRTVLHLGLCALFLLLTGCASSGGGNEPADAGRRSPTGAQASAGSAGRIGTPNYDVVLEVPELRVDSIGLEVDSLTAHLALNAQAANLVHLAAGVDVRIDSVALGLSGVFAEAYLYIDLDNVARIVDRVVTTLERNPQILTGLLQTVDTAVGTVGNVGQTLLQPGGVASQAVGAVGQTLNNVTAPGGILSQTVNTLGQTVFRTVDAAGNIAERTVNSAGSVVGTRNIGNLLNLRDLQVLQETKNAAGQTVRRVQDTSGAVLEYTLDTAGRLLNTRVVQQGGQR